MKDNHVSWWQTFPGCLTGLAGVITAITGLVVALHQTGFLQGMSNGSSTTSASVATKVSPDRSNQFVLSSPTTTSSSTATLQTDGLEPNEVKAVIADSDGYTNVRAGRGTTFEIVARVNNDEVFYTIPQTNTDWWPVRTSKGKLGYIHRSKMKIQDSN